MKKEVVVTGDGSKTIHMPELNESYHSTHGALQEAEHVFVKYGLAQLDKGILDVFELGYGTGLNAILAYRFSKQNNVQINYVGVEAYPVSMEMLEALDYTDFLSADEKGVFIKMHKVAWGDKVELSDQFKFQKVEQKIEDYRVKEGTVDIIFFDAFGPRTQGELWQPVILKKMAEMLREKGVLTTYCAQGQFRRDLKSVGFDVTKVPGPPGKREMTVAFKL
ncbi:MAG: tRNA (5-methylaminomethyl-2-thiouridine)(34)-methyltransferase MnmD [Crocinitomicaceae bacterium]